MTNSWRQSINQSSEQEEISNIEDYTAVDVFDEFSAIDDFYESIQKLLSIATPSFMKNNIILGPLFMVGIISITENYFRELFSKLITTCPVCRQKASSKTVSIGSIIWQKEFHLSKVSFEHISFAGSDAIIKATKDYVGYTIEKSSSIALILNEFNKLCELRHSIVHSHGNLKGKNAVNLQLQPRKESIRVHLGYNEIQECASICTTLVKSFNMELFAEIARRWAVDKKNIYKDRNGLFKEIWDIFYSAIDQEKGRIDVPLGMVKCRNQIKKEYNL